MISIVEAERKCRLIIKGGGTTEAKAAAMEEILDGFDDDTVDALLKRLAEDVREARKRRSMAQGTDTIESSVTMDEAADPLNVSKRTVKDVRRVRGKRSLKS